MVLVGVILGIQVGMILGFMVIIHGGRILIVIMVHLGASAGAGEVFTPDIIALGTIHGLVRLGAGAVDIIAEATGVVAIGVIIITIQAIIHHLVDIMQMVAHRIGIIVRMMEVEILDIIQEEVAILL